MTSRKKHKFRLLLRWIFVILGGFFFLSEILGSFLISAARVSSRSMAPNYAIGDRVIISHLAYGMTLPFTDIPLSPISRPRHGQAVIMRGDQDGEKHLPVLRDLWDFFTLNSPPPGRKRPWERGFILRRIIALPGDRVYLNGGRPLCRFRELETFSRRISSAQNPMNFFSPRRNLIALTFSIITIQPVFYWPRGSSLFCRIIA